MNKIYFVTSNEKKVISAQKYITNLELVYFKYEMIEPRSESLEEIASYKVMQAYEQVKSNCIVLDNGLYIEALNDWPKTYINFNLKHLGIEGILKLMENKENRNVYFKDCLAYYDGKDIKYFYGMSKGYISNYISEVSDPKEWSNLWRIFIPLNCNKTQAEMTDEERLNRPDGHTSPFKEFNDFARKLTL